ncbi:chromate efflux transporter [Acetobacter orleanensis]|uniref:Chromate transporter n=1 Tax=Acetobacter orleanensis TaxID=104099 RepID=A0A4Y3TMU3_9PROT|nr:chromate efflux transporter [Acetobacter orleanensis]PCD79000.1 chromate transporter [Acetobacter orleanensis]GAN67767.1 chromate transporter [Acetobacter orleanensis JCM 7639]GEB83104.1 chromate transporter [Acetobacter orleanensis]
MIRQGSVYEVLLVFLHLGLTSFGGPAAHLGYFRDAIVARRQWLDEAAYADIVALCQFLPGPASSQVAVSVGILRAGLPGGIAAWFGFSIPSALALIAFGYGVTKVRDITHAPWLHGLKIVAVAVVAQAVWNMARTLCPDRTRASLCVGAAVLAFTFPSALGQIGAIVLGGAIGWCCLSGITPQPKGRLSCPISRTSAFVSLMAFIVLAVALPVMAATGSHLLQLINAFYRSGYLVFGGGHVALPLLQRAVIPSGWIDNDTFLAGYGVAQAVPGPLFTFAAYLGTVTGSAPNGISGGLICLIAIYLPSFLLLVGILPFWDTLRRQASVQAALRGVNAAVVGLLLAALYTPVWTSGITGSRDFGIGIVAFLALVFWKMPPWIVVIAGAVVALITS